MRPVTGLVKVWESGRAVVAAARRRTGGVLCHHSAKLAWEILGITLVVCKVEGLRKFSQAFFIIIDGSDEKSHRFGRITSSPFFAGFFEVDTH